jgi:2-polyprenyl-3-methyl-5-hydroxy-6-metoxy-1,4-benzoquinol methylase
MKRRFHQNNIRYTRISDSFWPTSQIYDSLSEAERQFSTQETKFKKYARELLDLLPKGQGKLLDVGCGLGWVVAEAHKRGFDAMGIDQAKPFVVTGKERLNANLYLSDLEHFQTEEKFDVVVLKHVLEHVKNADKFLQKAHQLLNKKGLLLIACPNIDSLMFWIFQDRWYGLQPAQHVWQFTPKLISEVISRNGFLIEKVITNSLDYDVPGLKGIAFKILTSVANLINKGDQVVVIAKKVTLS